MEHNLNQQRLTFPTPENMTREQREVYDAVVSGPRGRVVGPLRAVIHNPVLASHWQQLGRVLRYETSLPMHLNELAILVTARRWSSTVEWSIHRGEALKAGFPNEPIDAIKHGQQPNFSGMPEAAEIYEFCRQTLVRGDVSDGIYERVKRRWGEVGIVELTSVIGYYSLVAMTLNVHQVPLPKEEHDTLEKPSDGLFELPEIDLPETELEEAEA